MRGAWGRCQVCNKVVSDGKTINGQYFCHNCIPVGTGTMICPSCGANTGGSLGTAFCPLCMMKSVKNRQRTASGTVTGTSPGNKTATATAAALQQAMAAVKAKKMSGFHYDTLVYDDFLDVVDYAAEGIGGSGPEENRTAMISKKVVTPTQAFNEMHMLLSALLKQYGTKKKTKNGEEYWEISLKGSILEDAGFVAERQRLSCTKDVATLDYKVYLNFEDDNG